jgi:hypothetical protein
LGVVQLRRQCALFIQLQIEKCARARSFGQQAQSLAHDAPLPLHISDPANSTAKEVGSYDGPRHLELLRQMSKGANVDNDG